MNQLTPGLLSAISRAQSELDWLRQASGAELLEQATDQLQIKSLRTVATEMSAIELGNLSRDELMKLLEPHFKSGTSTASDLADQIQLARAFQNPDEITEYVAERVIQKVEKFPRHADDLRVGSNPGDVLDPFILAANYELLSEGNLQKTLEHTASHKVLMKIEDLIGHLHEGVIGFMRGNFRVPEPRGDRKSGKEQLNPELNPFPGADVGQVPTLDRPNVLRLFQVKSKTGSAKGGDGKRLGEQLEALARVYSADTFYVSIVGNTLRGHRSRGAVERASPETAILVGDAALNELTQSSIGAELLLRTYQRGFRTAAERTGYRFSEIVHAIAADFEAEAERAGTDFLSSWLHDAVGGPRNEQDSRAQRKPEAG